MHYVYILRCADDALYVGETNDLARRLLKHQEGIDSRFTAIRRPVAMIYAEEHPNRATALARERQLKGRTRAKKEALVTGNLARLKAYDACDAGVSLQPEPPCAQRRRAAASASAP